ncbi:MAG: carbamate kinase [Nitrospinae bacterium CG11_big_fil_rev_8_21_14_0_20_45_15]|nr:MAG: carbamate kinase [Nitrospinae bacterium CG11_big_fil_rev_8_21_14_0_20_45_15]
MTRKPVLLISFGGNALTPADTIHPHQREEFDIAYKSMSAVVDLVEKGFDKIILTHGNGPQVGQIFLQQELTKHEFPRQVTLDVCVADSQGRIGYILQNVFDNICQERKIDKKSFAVITQVIVDSKDPAFNRPTKPIGLFYSKIDADKLIKERGWEFMEDAGRGYRRVVASPIPLEIVESEIFHELLERGFIAIGGGGGGIPVIRKSNGALVGVEAVIDKDRTSALLANALKVDQLIILTSVDGACLNFNSANPQLIKEVTISQMEAYIEQGEFSEGSMKPKAEAVVQFIKNGGEKAIIANLNALIPAIEGKAGTHVTA